jgi:hypothetical protein
VSAEEGGRQYVGELTQGQTPCGELVELGVRVVPEDGGAHSGDGARAEQLFLADDHAQA